MHEHHCCTSILVAKACLGQLPQIGSILLHNFAHIVDLSRVRAYLSMKRACIKSEIRLANGKAFDFGRITLAWLANCVCTPTCTPQSGLPLQSTQGVVWLLGWYDQWFVTQFNAPTGGISSLSFVRLATNCISSGTMLHNILHSHCGMVVPESTNWKPTAGCLLRAVDCSMTAPHYHVRWAFCLGSWRIQPYYSWRLVYVKSPAAFLFFWLHCFWPTPSARLVWWGSK